MILIPKEYATRRHETIEHENMVRQVPMTFQQSFSSTVYDESFTCTPKEAKQRICA